MGNVSSSMDNSVTPLKKISPHSEMEGGQMPADSHEKDFGSQGKMNAKSIRGSKSGKNDTTKATFDRDSKGANQTDKSIAGKNSLSKKAKDFGVETQRISAHVNKGTPDGKRKRVPSASPESFNRSRSGRLLMPTLEFWRNQRAVYTADRSVAGIVQGTDAQPRIKEEGGDLENGEMGSNAKRWRFSKELKRHHFHYCRMDFPKEFAVGTGIVKKGKIILEDGKKRKWVVKLTTRNDTMYGMSCGWKRFVVANDGVIGSVVSYEFVSGNLLRAIVTNKTK